MKYHGRPHGAISADEHLAGLDPSRGTELCLVSTADVWQITITKGFALQVAEQMYSGSYLYQLFGDNKFADGVEQMAYNALPGTLTGDMWSRQVCLCLRTEIGSLTNLPLVPSTAKPDQRSQHEVWWRCALGLLKNSYIFLSPNPFKSDSPYSNVFGKEPAYVRYELNFASSYCEELNLLYSPAAQSTTHKRIPSLLPTLS